MCFTIYDTYNESKQNFVNWYLHGVRDRERGPKSLLFIGNATFISMDTWTLRIKGFLY